ncbi:hypothetical protein EVAR_54738_1 [Eumeta japonica]|uniref:Uncharacterized protein n=1 Tax=Eumeta variegata TaxID=151549 RepID=A0A4C1YYK8_EUMVA|nr:hypothetical protein EVAR_54738_1 [Eumeta japonica]
MFTFRLTSERASNTTTLSYLVRGARKYTKLFIVAVDGARAASSHVTRPESRRELASGDDALANFEIGITPVTTPMIENKSTDRSRAAALNDATGTETRAMNNCLSIVQKQSDPIASVADSRRADGRKRRATPMERHIE